MTEILDSQGNTIRVGMRTLENDGTIVAISDPDGDVNEYGRAVGINPYVTVRYDDGGVTYHHDTEWNATGPWDDHRDDYTCDDVTVLVDAKPDSLNLPPVPVWDGEPQEFRETRMTDLLLRTTLKTRGKT